MQHREERLTKHKICSHLYESDPEDEEVMAAKCHSDEIYISIQSNREDDEYCHLLNQQRGELA